MVSFPGCEAPPNGRTPAISLNTKTACKVNHLYGQAAQAFNVLNFV
jgi:hypothetical protein